MFICLKNYSIKIKIIMITFFASPILFSSDLNPNRIKVLAYVKN